MQENDWAMIKQTRKLLEHGMTRMFPQSILLKHYNYNKLTTGQNKVLTSN